MNGFLLIDKEKGMTSFDVVRQVRGMSGEQKVGHAGTLDPLATGLLVIALGEGTKLLEFFIGCDKEYEVAGKFGWISDTYDAEGRIVRSGSENDSFSKEDVEAAVEADFLGEIEQVPPVYSALKVGGKKAYELARKGKKVELAPRRVRVDAFEVIDFDWPMVRFRVKCGSGTYIRSLIHDLGQKLGCGGYVEELRRIFVADFSLEDSVKLEDLYKNFEQRLVSLEEVVKGFKKLDLSDEDYEGLEDGKILEGKKVEGEWAMGFYKGKLVGVVENSSDGKGIKFRKRVL